MKKQINGQEKLARAVSDLYPPIVLPENKNDWNAGHFCLSYFYKNIKRNQLLIPTLLSEVLFAKRMQIKERLWQKKLDYLLTHEFSEFFSFYEKRKAFYQLYLSNIMSTLAKLRLRKKLKIENLAHSRLADLRTHHPFYDLIFEHNIANCGELAYIAYGFLYKKKIPAHCVCLSYADMETDPNHHTHCFVLFRTDGVKTDFKTAMANLYHPNTRICDLWLGKCAHPVEMFQEYANIFSRLDKNKHITRLKNGTIFAINSLFEKTDNPTYYMVGHITKNLTERPDDTWHRTFHPVCIPHQCAPKWMDKINREKIKE